MACECGACVQCRYLWLHNYNLTVTEVFAAINRPDLRSQMMASLQLIANTAAGDFDAFVEFLQYGQPLGFCLLHVDKSLDALVLCWLHAHQALGALVLCLQHVADTTSNHQLN